MAERLSYFLIVLIARLMVPDEGSAIMRLEVLCFT